MEQVENEGAGIVQEGQTYCKIDYIILKACHSLCFLSLRAFTRFICAESTVQEEHITHKLNIVNISFFT
jgi:hypothetical protein